MALTSKRAWALASRAPDLLRRGLAGGPRKVLQRMRIVASMLANGETQRLRAAVLPSGETPADPVIRFPQLRPLAVFPEPTADRRLTVVTDSIGPGSLFGGVGTALIIGALLAERLGCTLRVVTRTELPEPASLATILQLHGIGFTQKTEFLQSSTYGASRPVAVGPADMFLTTSWWSTQATLASIPARSILYLCQEDERMFYPSGDDRIRCDALMSRPDLRFLLNTALLKRHLVDSGLEAMERNGLSFEPAFPASIYHAGQRTPGAKRRFFFYARPQNPRNLYWRGLEAIEESIRQGVLDTELWAFDFVGTKIPKAPLSGRAEVAIWDTVGWQQYGQLVRGADIGLSLMATPHPSYPPLDLAASGALVVTNRYGVKTSLEQYSDSIICADLGVDALVEGIRTAVARAAGRDEAARRQAAASAGLARDWTATLTPMIETLAKDL